MKKDNLGERNALCFDCDSEICVFAQEGECRLPLLTGKLPVINEEGCLAGMPFTDEWTSKSQMTVSERAISLWLCICKTMESAPKGSKMWGLRTALNCGSRENAEQISFVFNSLADGDFIFAAAETACLNTAKCDNTFITSAAIRDPDELWAELLFLAERAKATHDVYGLRAPVWSNGRALLIESKAAATAVKELFEILGCNDLDVRRTTL